jgi:hypothetical protein
LFDEERRTRYGGVVVSCLDYRSIGSWYGVRKG